MFKKGIFSDIMVKSMLVSVSNSLSCFIDDFIFLGLHSSAVCLQQNYISIHCRNVKINALYFMKQLNKK